MKNKQTKNAINWEKLRIKQQIKEASVVWIKLIFCKKQQQQKQKTKTMKKKDNTKP